MHRLQFCLHICAYAKLECRANKHADDSSVDLFIERDSRRLRCVAVDESYLKLCVGRDFSDCPIERGVFLGGGDQTQTVFMKVTEQ